MITGYTRGVFDLFHVGHLNLLRRARAQCDRLIVGVVQDELALSYKGRRPVIPSDQRLEIVAALSCVDQAIPAADRDNILAWKRLNFAVVFVGDDWKDTDRWNEEEVKLKAIGVAVVYLPYTQHVSSSKIIEKIRRG